MRRNSVGTVGRRKERKAMRIMTSAPTPRKLAVSQRGGRALFAHFETSAETSAVFGAHATSDQIRDAKINVECLGSKCCERGTRDT